MGIFWKLHFITGSVQRNLQIRQNCEGEKISSKNKKGRASQGFILRQLSHASGSSAPAAFRPLLTDGFALSKVVKAFYRDPAPQKATFMYLLNTRHDSSERLNIVTVKLSFASWLLLGFLQDVIELAGGSQEGCKDLEMCIIDRSVRLTEGKIEKKGLHLLLIPNKRQSEVVIKLTTIRNHGVYSILD
jgi:hypothetical protein